MAVARDLDLVLLDAHTPLGNGAVFPAGILREPVTALQRADLVLFTRSTTEQASAPPRLPAGVMPPVPWLFAHHQPTGWIHADGSMQPLDQIHDTPVLACCGIARPHTFRETLATLGVSVAGWATFPDHHPYTNDDLRHLRQQALACGARALVCTEKDWVKLTRFPPVLPIHALGIELMFHTPPTALYTAVDRLVAEIKTGSRSRTT
jgi:tetraacyldisaccharide 4'-kinase